MRQDLSHLYEIFTRTEGSIRVFMDMLSPVIANSQDEHERLYFHHIFEEEEQRLERLSEFLPKLASYVDRADEPVGTDPGFILLLQDINLEKFGLHNFLEHVELSLFEFQDEERSSILRPMQEETRADYLAVKDILARFNEAYLPQASMARTSDQHHVASAAHDHDHDHDHNNHQHEPVVRTMPTIPARKGLSVGSLRSVR